MKALVTGGGGFLGGAIVRLLRERGDEVRSFARGAYPALEAAGVEVHRGNLGDAAAVSRAVQGMDVVFHVAALPGVWGPYADYHRTNVSGTEHVLAGCRRHEVRRLVFTSTPSVVYGGRDIEGGDESLPYASTFSTHYPRTKAVAERMVLAADGERLSTVALRPHLVWGPRDNHLVPRIVARGRAGRLRLIGDRPNVVDTVYVDNAADAHLAAADRLAPGAPCAGKAYFISNGEPLPLAEITNGILAAAGLPPVTKRIPVPVAVALGGAGRARVRRAAHPERAPAHALRGPPALHCPLVRHLGRSQGSRLPATGEHRGGIASVGRVLLIAGAGYDMTLTARAN